MAGNQSVIERLNNFMERLEQASGNGWTERENVTKQALSRFEAGMDNDLNTPEALAAVFDFMSEVNKAFADLSTADAAAVRAVMERFDSVLGLLSKASDRTLTAEEQALIDERQQYRLAKDWAKADALKAQLADRGIEVKDTPQGPVVKFVS